MDRRDIPWGMWAAFAAALVLCLIAAVSAYRLAQYSWAQVVEYTSPFVSANPPAELVSTEPTPSPALVRRVVLVIVDGLREDVSRTSMPTLNSLRSYGSDISLTVPQPSLSFPNWTTILTGASPTVSGVTTNWHTARVLAPTLIDVTRAAGNRVVVVGPTDFAKLYRLAPGPKLAVSLRPWPKPEEYASAKLVDDALRLSKETSPSLLVVHLPDVDEAGHEHGGSSKQYADTAARVDGDISRLVAGLQSDGTTFIVTADHGHLDTGGHGGWEPVTLHVPGVFAGADIQLSKGSGLLQQIAPTVSVLLGQQDPAYAEDQALRSVFLNADESIFGADVSHHLEFAAHYVGVVSGITPAREQLFADGGPDAAMQAARADRLARERGARFTGFLIGMAALVFAVALIGLLSWRALVAGLVGTAVYYAIYETLFFVVHGLHWSLAAFNKDSLVTTFMDWRMGEAALASLAGIAVAALVYPLLRSQPKGPQDARYLPGYLALGTSTTLLMIGSLGAQVAFYLWQWGAPVVWTLPDLGAGFKYDLDLVQMTAVGASALLAPLVTYLIGRYHPKVRTHTPGRA